MEIALWFLLLALHMWFPYTGVIVIQKTHL